MKTLVLKCVDVIDHGHCSTSRWSSPDERAVLSLYVLTEDGVPTTGDTLELRDPVSLDHVGTSIPMLHPVDHMDGAIATPQPFRSKLEASFPEFAASLATTNIPPPVSNEHVAAGCELFQGDAAQTLDTVGEDPGLQPTGEAVSSLDTPGQILGAAAEHDGSDS